MREVRGFVNSPRGLSLNEGMHERRCGSNQQLARRPICPDASHCTVACWVDARQVGDVEFVAGLLCELKVPICAARTDGGRNEHELEIPGRAEIGQRVEGSASWRIQARTPFTLMLHRLDRHRQRAA